MYADATVQQDPNKVRTPIHTRAHAHARIHPYAQIVSRKHRRRQVHGLRLTGARTRTRSKTQDR